MSILGNKNEYEIIVARKWMPVETAIVVRRAPEHDIFLEKNQTPLDIKMISEMCDFASKNRKKNNRNVLILGTYYHSKCIERLAECFKSVTVFVYSKKDVGFYSNVKDVKYKDFQSFFGLMYLSNSYDWVNLLVGHYLMNDNYDKGEALWRGIRSYTPRISILEVMHMLENGKFVLANVMGLGEPISKIYSQNAKERVKYFGTYITCFNYEACVVTCDIPVIPSAVAAADAADIGINMRYDRKNKCTRFTFITKHPDKVDMGFVERKFNGGGSDNFKGATIKGFCPFPMTDIEEIFSTGA